MATPEEEMLEQLEQEEETPEEMQLEDQVEEQVEEPEVSEVEEKAMKMGWVPKDQFKGDPDHWRPAEEFVERGENMIPIIRKRAETAEQRAQAAEKKAESVEKYVKMLRDKLHEKEKAAIEAKKRQAVADGDEEAYDRYSKEEIELPDFEEEKPSTPEVDPQMEQEFREWGEKNQWYNTDPDKAVLADSYGAFLKRTQPELSNKEWLNKISDYVETKFSNQNRRKASAVDGGTPKARSTAASMFDKLDDSAKKQFSRFVEDGIFKNTKEEREAFAKDVLA